MAADSNPEWVRLAQDPKLRTFLADVARRFTGKLELREEMLQEAMIAIGSDLAANPGEKSTEYYQKVGFRAIENCYRRNYTRRQREVLAGLDPEALKRKDIREQNRLRQAIRRVAIKHGFSVKKFKRMSQKSVFSFNGTSEGGVMDKKTEAMQEALCAAENFILLSLDLGVLRLFDEVRLGLEDVIAYSPILDGIDGRSVKAFFSQVENPGPLLRRWCEAALGAAVNGGFIGRPAWTAARREEMRVFFERFGLPANHPPAALATGES